jgi:hypothetical protein
MSENVEVRIVGDASGVQPAVDSAESSVGGLRGIIADVNAFLDSMRAKFTEVGVAGGGAGAAIRSGMAGAVAATEAEGNAVTAMVMKIHEGAESVRTFQMRAKEFAEVYVAIFAVETIAHWVEALGAAAERTEHLAVITGMTTAQIQGLNGAATMSGVSMESLAKALERLDMKTVSSVTDTQAGTKALRAMGIEAHDSSTNMERLLKIADKFHDMADGPMKTAIAMQLFGRAGAEMIPFLNQGSAAIQQLMDKTKELGAVNEAAQAQGEKLASSVNEATVAWAGLKNTLLQAFGPLLIELVDGFIALVKAMKDSYDSGGLIKTLFDGISEAASGIIEIVHDIGLAFSQVFQATGSEGTDWGALIKTVVDGIVDLFKVLIAACVFVADAFIAAFDLIKAGANNFLANWREQTGQIQVIGVGLGEFMKVVGKVCEDALLLHWGSIGADWDAGMQHVRDVVQQRTNEILATTAHLRQQATDDFNAAMNLGKTYGQFAKGLFTENYHPPHDAFKFKFGGGGAGDPDITSSPGGGQKAKDTLVRDLEEQLEAKKAEWEKEQIAQGTAQEFSLQSEADFWDEALKRTDLSAKDRFEITKKWISAEQALQKERISVVLDEDKKELFEADKNAQAKLAIMRRESDFAHKMWGDQSEQARAADLAVLEAERAAAEQQIQLIEGVAKARADAALAQIDDAEKSTQMQEQIGLISQSKMLAAERQYEEARYRIALQYLQLERSLIDPNRDPLKYQQVSLQIEQLERQHQQKMSDIDRQAVLARTQIERQAIQAVAQSWGQTIGQMLTLQVSFHDGVIQLWQGLVQAIGNAIAGIVEQWLTQMLTAMIIGKANAITQGAGTIGAHAAEAAAGAYAATAAIPIVGPELAPAAAATAYTGAISWIGALGAVSAAGGDYRVHEGMYHLHEDEMVLPTWAASPLRKMIQAADHPSSYIGNADATRFIGGDAHYHYEPTLNHSDASWDEMVRRDGAGARRWFMSQWKQGRLRPQER